MDYQPVVTATGAALRVTALVGAHAVNLGFDLLGRRVFRRRQPTLPRA